MLDMKNLRESLKYGFGTFVGTSVVLTWLQGGGRYNYNAHINPLLYLYIAFPVGLVVGIIIYVQELKNKKR